MSLPMLKRCCWCLSLETGCFLLAVTSTLASLVNIGVGCWELPHHDERNPEDNLISMSMVMFSTLSAITDLIAVAGVLLRRPNYLQVTFLFNSVFILCIFLVAVVTCIFSPELRPIIENPLNLFLVLMLLVLGVAYSMYYLIVVNSLYRKMKLNYTETSYPIEY